MNKKNIKSIVIFGVFSILLISLTIAFWPYIQSLSTDVGLDNLRQTIDSLGVGGWFVMLGIQVLQIIVAFLPGEPIEIVMGIFYGSIGGMFTCLFGILIGSMIVYGLTKLIGVPFVKLFVDLDDLKKYKFLNDSKKLDLTVFILFFIPAASLVIIVSLVGGTGDTCTATISDKLLKTSLLYVSEFGIPNPGFIIRSLSSNTKGTFLSFIVFIIFLDNSVSIIIFPFLSMFFSSFM